MEGGLCKPWFLGLGMGPNGSYPQGAAVRRSREVHLGLYIGVWWFLEANGLAWLSLTLWSCLAPSPAVHTERETDLPTDTQAW